MFDKTKSGGITYTFDTPDTVTAVEFCPLEQFSQLIAYGDCLRVSLGICRFQDEDSEIDGFEFEHLRDFHHGTRVTTIAWSPETSLETLPRQVKFCTAGADSKLRLFSSDLKSEDTVTVMDGHTSYVNDVVFEPTEGQQIASVSDDHTCRVWDLDGLQRACFPLYSPGMSVCWHPDEPAKLMVAEKKGTIRFYDLITHQPIMSLDAGHVTLMSADICFLDPVRIGCIANGNWMMWDSTRSSLPQENRQAHNEGGRNFRWSRVSENLFATTGQNEVKVFHLGHSQVPVSSSLPITAGGLSWHATLPVCAVGGDRKVHLWMTEI
ncbi:nucleoporin Nup37-like isoform X2 [Ptychodera flava]|uniref:nucleoporin Nup37-like isoform X2 n=1 Tax=Ptychodera flava TaxID=63121 RepID=UPI003969E2C4